MPRNDRKPYRYTGKTVADLGGNVRILLNVTNGPRVVIELSDVESVSIPDHIEATCVSNSENYWVGANLWPGNVACHKLNPHYGVVYEMWTAFQRFLLAEGFLEPDPTYKGG